MLPGYGWPVGRRSGLDSLDRLWQKEDWLEDWERKQCAKAVDLDLHASYLPLYLPMNPSVVYNYNWTTGNLIRIQPLQRQVVSWERQC